MRIDRHGGEPAMIERGVPAVPGARRRWSRQSSTCWLEPDDQRIVERDGRRVAQQLDQKLDRLNPGACTWITGVQVVV